MQGVRIDRLWLRAAGLIVHRMKTDLLHYPTVAEMRALEAAAHRERAREVARLLRAGAHAAGLLLARLAVVLVPKGIRHA